MQAMHTASNHDYNDALGALETQDEGIPLSDVPETSDASDTNTVLCLVFYPGREIYSVARSPRGAPHPIHVIR